LDMLPLQARFASQDQAESVIRKLASLRSETFRLERMVPNGVVDGASMMDISASGVNLNSSVASKSTYDSSSSEEFTLSASVPGAVADQARNVIMQAGGQVV
jgi:hypothetical protein